MADRDDVRKENDKDFEAALAEPGDLSRSERLRILVAERDIATKTLWHVLGLRGEPTAADVKKAYFALSKQFHPDRYFGKELGSFEERLRVVFRGIKRAHDVLGNGEKRAAYEAEHPPLAAERKLPDPRRRGQPVKKKKPGPALGDEKRKRLDERRAQILAERKKKQKGPRLPKSNKQRGKEFYELGMEQLRNGDLAAAAASFRLAVSNVPDDAEYQVRFEETNHEAVQARAKELEERAALEAATGQNRNAAKLYSQAADLMPLKGGYAIKAGELFALAGDRETALIFARRGVEASPGRKEAQCLLAQLLEEDGELAGALRHFEAAAEIDRGDAEVRRAVKRLSKQLRV